MKEETEGAGTPVMNKFSMSVQGLGPNAVKESRQGSPWCWTNAGTRYQKGVCWWPECVVTEIQLGCERVGDAIEDNGWPNGGDR